MASNNSDGTLVNPASGKGTIISRPTEQKEKRSHSEVADSSLGDEFASIQKQLDQINTEMYQTREDFKSLMKKRNWKHLSRT